MASWAVVLPALTFKQKVQGTVSCGVLTGSGQANIFGTVSKGTTKCTFDAGRFSDGINLDVPKMGHLEAAYELRFYRMMRQACYGEPAPP